MASVTLTFAPAVGTRVAAALGKTLGLVDGAGVARSATAAEYADWLRDVTRRMVQGQELQDAHTAIPQPPSVDLT